MRGRFWFEENQVDGFIRDGEFMRDLSGKHGVVEFQLNGVRLLFTSSARERRMVVDDRGRRRLTRNARLGLDSFAFDGGCVRRPRRVKRRIRRPWFRHALFVSNVLFSFFFSPERLSFQLLPDRFHRTIVNHQNPFFFSSISIFLAIHQTLARKHHDARPHVRLSRHPNVPILHRVRNRVRIFNLHSNRIPNRIFDLKS